MRLFELSDKRIFFLIFLVGFLLCTSSIGQYPISILDEAKNAEAAREMFSEGHTFYPTFNGKLRTDKPPLHYLFMQLAFTFFGVNAFAARFFSGILGGLLLAFFFCYVQKFTERKTAVWAVFVLGSSIFWIQEFHMAVPDPYLIFFLTLSWLSFYDFFKYKKKWSLWLFYVGTAFALLSKGPVALLFSGLIAMLWLAKKRQLFRKIVWSYKPIWGLLLIFVISAPWFVWMHIKTQGAYSEGFFLGHNLQRFASEMEGHGGSFLVTWLFVLLGLFPLGMFLPQAVVAFFKDRKRQDFYEYSALVAVIVVVFFSLSGTRLPNYTLPAIPFLSVLLAYYFRLSTQKKYCIPNAISYAFVVIITLVLPVVVYIVFRQFHEDFNGWYCIGLGAISTLGSGFIVYFMLKKKYVLALNSTGILWIIIGMYVFYFLYPCFFAQKEVTELKKILHNKEVKVYKSFDPALAFQMKRTFLYTDEKSVDTAFAKNPEVLLLSKNKFFQADSLSVKYNVLWEKQTLFEGYKCILLMKK